MTKPLFEKEFDILCKKIDKQNVHSIHPLFSVRDYQYTNLAPNETYMEAWHFANHLGIIVMSDLNTKDKFEINVTLNNNVYLLPKLAPLLKFCQDVLGSPYISKPNLTAEEVLEIGLKIANASFLDMI